MPLSKIKEIQSSAMRTVVSPEDRGPAANIATEDRHLMIAEAAYFRALARGFQGGNAEEDWYAAEAEINRITGS